MKLISLLVSMYVQNIKFTLTTMQHDPNKHRMWSGITAHIVLTFSTNTCMQCRLKASPEMPTLVLKRQSSICNIG